jgi:hypothetical protein
VNITGGSDLRLEEISTLMASVRQKVHPQATILFGTVEDPACEGSIRVTLVATGFEPRVSHQSGAGALPRPAPVGAGGEPRVDPRGWSAPALLGGGADVVEAPRAAYRASGADLRVLPGRASGSAAGEARGRDDLAGRDAPRVALEGPAGLRSLGAVDAVGFASSGREQSPWMEADEPRVGRAELRPAAQGTQGGSPAEASSERPAFSPQRRLGGSR